MPRSIRSPYPLPGQDEQAEIQPAKASAEAAPEQVAQVVPLRDGQPAKATPAQIEQVKLLGKLIDFAEGPLADWIARERPAYMASPITFVRERWEPQWLPRDVGFLVWSWRVLLLFRALVYSVFYVPAMVVYLPELTTAAVVAYLILHFFA